MLGMNVLCFYILAFFVYSAEGFAGCIFTASGERTGESEF